MRTLTIPNILSGLRLVAAPIIPAIFFFSWNPLSFLWDGNLGVVAFSIALVLALTDYVDGKLATWLRQESALGKRLDPLADFVFCSSLFASVFIVYFEHLILLVAWIFFAGYFLWYAYAAARLRKRGRIDNPNQNAREATGLLMTSLVLVIFGTFMWFSVLWHALAIVGIMRSALFASKALDEYELPVRICTCSNGVEKSGANLFPPS